MARALGRYELLRPLARGGMADVYLARRRAAGIEKWLVVKRMRPETSGDPRFLELFVREARLSMSLVHQNIVPVFDFGRIDDQVFLAMERVEGKDLGSSLSRATGHRMPPLLAAFIAAECCQALDYAHQRKGPDGVALGIVHRDVTPRNVLLSWSGEVKLTDFGIAALAGDATSRLLGTPHYMAPEQARSEACDPRADVYAIGLVLREAITGVRPRPGADRDTILEAARRGALEPWPAAPTTVPPLAEGTDPPIASEPVPPTLVAIVERATGVAPADRYPDARSMLAELDAFIVAERAAHRAESPARQLAAWLAVVWDGAREDAEADAAIDGDHLVSFIDDGAIDVVGTGTVRSLVATAAEDSKSEPLPIRRATPAAGMPALGAPPPPPPAPLPPAVSDKAGDVRGRLSRITSSTSTVASGSFHTIPVTKDVETAWAKSRPPRRGISPALRLVLVGVGTGAAVFGVMTALHTRGPEPLPPSPAPPPATNPALAVPASLDTAGSGVGSSGSSGHVADGAPANTDGSAAAAPGQGGDAGSGDDAGRGSAAARSPSNTVAVAAESKPTKVVRPDSGHPIGPPPGHPTPRSAVSHAVPDPVHAATRPDLVTTQAGSATGSATLPGSGDAPHAATCKVRLNITPWAYFTTDTDPSRHETPGTVELTAGPHRIHVWNPELHVERDITIEVPGDRATMSYSEPLQPSSLPPR